jgi:hypothetical protein
MFRTSGELNMTKKSQISRRAFVGSAISTAAVGSPPFHHLMAFARQSGPSSSDRNWRDEGVLFVDKSPYAKLHSVPVHAVTITEGFWGARRRTNVDKSIPSMEQLLEANGRMKNFLRLAGKSDAPQHGPVFSDSDVYKWIEAVGFALQSGDNPELRAQADTIIKEVIAVQEPSGYLNTYYVGDRTKDRMTPEVQRWGHELYNLGHMIQGAIAFYRATGDRTLLDASIRFVDGRSSPGIPKLNWPSLSYTARPATSVICRWPGTSCKATIASRSRVTATFITFAGFLSLLARIWKAMRSAPCTPVVAPQTTT